MENPPATNLKACQKLPSATEQQSSRFQARQHLNSPSLSPTTIIFWRSQHTFYGITSYDTSPEAQISIFKKSQALLEMFVKSNHRLLGQWSWRYYICRYCCIHVLIHITSNVKTSPRACYLTIQVLELVTVLKSNSNIKDLHHLTQTD